MLMMNDELVDVIKIVRENNIDSIKTCKCDIEGNELGNSGILEYTITKDGISSYFKIYEENNKYDIKTNIVLKETKTGLVSVFKNRVFEKESFVRHMIDLVDASIHSLVVKI